MSETMGRCRSEVDDCYGGLPLVAIADAIDRLAEDVAAIKAAILPQTTEERDAAIRERDEARAEVERLRAELAARRSMAPVVEVPAMPLEVGDANTHMGQYLRGRRDIAVSYRAALDKAGVAWKAVGRE